MANWQKKSLEWRIGKYDIERCLNSPDLSSHYHEPWILGKLRFPIAYLIIILLQCVKLLQWGKYFPESRSLVCDICDLLTLLLLTVKSVTDLGKVLLAMDFFLKI